MKQLITLLIALILFTGCSSLKVYYDFDKEASFTHLTTYKWGASDKAHDALEKDPLFKKNVMFLTDSIFAQKQFTLVKDSTVETDFIVVIFAAVKADTSVVTTVDQAYYGAYPSYGRVPYGSYNYGWYNPWYGPSMSVGVGINSASATTSTQVHREGTLIFDIVDGKTNQLIWRGTAEKTLQEFKMNQKQQAGMTRNVVTKVLRNFPPEKQ